MVHIRGNGHSHELFSSLRDSLSKNSDLKLRPLISDATLVSSIFNSVLCTISRLADMLPALAPEGLWKAGVPSGIVGDRSSLGVGNEMVRLVTTGWF